MGSRTTLTHPRSATPFLVTTLSLVMVGLLTLACTTPPPTPAEPPVADDGNDVQPLPFVPSPAPPHDIFVFDPGSTGIQEPIDVLSWSTFIALNWPASAVQNGVPDRNNTIGGFQPDPEGGAGEAAGPTVWETFKEVNDIFLNPPTEPTAFNATQTIPSGCPKDVLQPSNVKGVDPVATRNYHVLYDNLVSFTDDNLVDQNGNVVWYEVRFNEVYFNFVVEKGYYDKDNQPAQITFPAGSNVTRELGAIRVKAAWKILDTAKGDDPTRFYTSNALIVDPSHDPPCRPELVGLVGMHIAHKTVSRPQWIWSTFEQIDNDPTKGEPLPSDATFSFNDPSCTNCTPNKATKAPTPTQLVRDIPVAANAALINPSYQQAMTQQGNGASVWQFYELVNTQWPTDPAAVATFGDPTPQVLANTVIEPFFQTDDTSAKPPHSCMKCHGEFALATDFGFQLQKACSGKHPKPNCGAATVAVVGTEGLGLIAGH